jgi:hydroxymethylpyrimidine pyrophosphatase-like HAD family hydrolase
MKNKLTFAVDFDGTLCSYAFPNIGEQTEHQKQLLDLLIKLKEAGHKLILWTNRGDNEEYKSLLEAIEWCKNKGLEFDCINKNLPETEMKKISGYSPKIMADYYIDDKALAFNTSIDMSNTLSFLQNIRDIDNEQM